MKRSEINKALQEMEATLNRYQINLPKFCHFTPEQWQEKGHEYDEVRENMLGWDITDYGLGDFDKVGFSLITLRNGNLALADKYPKTYAEKLMELVERGFSAAVYTQTTDVEGEVNGLVTYDREVVKVDVDRLHEVNRRLVRSLDL